MLATDYKTTSISTNEWLKTLGRQTIRAYAEAWTNPRSREAEVNNYEDLENVWKRAGLTLDTSTQTSFDQELEYLLVPYSVSGQLISQRAKSAFCVALPT